MMKELAIKTVDLQLRSNEKAEYHVAKQLKITGIVWYPTILGSTLDLLGSGFVRFYWPANSKSLSTIPVAE